MNRLRALAGLFAILSILHLPCGILADGYGDEFQGTSGDEASSLILIPKDDSSLIGFSMDDFTEMDSLDPDLTKRQGKCPFPVMCSPTTCCQAGTNCCDRAASKCCPTDSKCHPRGCCPNNAVTCGKGYCAPPGSVCCRTRACPGGSICNENGGNSLCCKRGDIKCHGTCCPAGSRCSTRRGYCLQPSTSTRTSTRTSRRTSTRSSTRTNTLTNSLPTISLTETSTDSSTSTSETSTPEPTDQCEVGSRKRSVVDVPWLEKRQNLNPPCTFECHDETWLPTIIIEDIPGRTDQLFVSMCAGILATGGNRGGDGNFDFLTYSTVGNSSRAGAGGECGNFCAQQKRIFDDPNRLQCDEYPPAMAAEGGKGAHKTCINGTQNSGTQAPIFSAFVRNCKPAEGQKFVVRMEGGCRIREPEDNTEADGFSRREPGTINRRQSPPIDAFGTAVSEFITVNNMSYVYVPIKDLANGHYRFQMSLKGEAKSVQIMDENGETYYNEPPGPNQLVEFDVTDINPVYSPPGAMIVEAGESVQISYNATVAPSSNSSGNVTTSAIPPLPTNDVAAKVGGELSWLMNILLLATGMFFIS